jgi:uncharacterized protein YgiM (DUF1202 family)
MPTKKPVVAVILDEETNRKLEDFQFNNRFKNKSSAVAFVIQAGMKALSEEYPELDLNVKTETGKKAPVDGLNEKRIHL